MKSSKAYFPFSCSMSSLGRSPCMSCPTIPCPTAESLRGNSCEPRSTPAFQVIAPYAEPWLKSVSKSFAIDIPALHNLEGLEQLQYVVLAKSPMRVEIDAILVVERNGHVQVSTGLDNTPEFLNSLFRTERVEGVAVAPQADVLHNTQTGDGGHRAAREGQIQNRTLLKCDCVAWHRERSQ